MMEHDEDVITNDDYESFAYQMDDDEEPIAIPPIIAAEIDGEVLSITDFNCSTFDSFKEIALTCFTQIDFKEELVTTIALLHVGTTLASGALIIDKHDYLIVQCLCTRTALHGLGYGSKLLLFLQETYESKPIHLLATSQSVEFYKKYNFESKYRSPKCECDRGGGLKHLVCVNKRRICHESTNSVKRRFRTGHL